MRSTARAGQGQGQWQGELGAGRNAQRRQTEPLAAAAESEGLTPLNHRRWPCARRAGAAWSVAAFHFVRCEETRRSGLPAACAPSHTCLNRTMPAVRVRAPLRARSRGKWEWERAVGRQGKGRGQTVGHHHPIQPAVARSGPPGHRPPPRAAHARRAKPRRGFGGRAPRLGRRLVALRRDDRGRHDVLPRERHEAQAHAVGDAERCPHEQDSVRRSPRPPEAACAHL